MAIKGKRTNEDEDSRCARRGGDRSPCRCRSSERRGVQVVAAFLVGALVFWGGVWLTNGLRAQDTSERTRAGAPAAPRRSRLGEAGRDRGRARSGRSRRATPPVILPQVRAATTGLAEKTPEGRRERAPDGRGGAREAIEASPTTSSRARSAARDSSQGEVLRFLSARDELVTSIQLYREAALLGAWRPTSRARIAETVDRPRRGRC